MRAWIVERPGQSANSLRKVELPRPDPGPHDILIRVSTCGVCRTDLHITQGDLPERASDAVVPGHEIVGEVAARGSDAQTFQLGDRVGVAWLRTTCGKCRYCRRGSENLCPSSRYTGWDAHGGYADYAVSPEAFTYALPGSWPDEKLSPLLCAGIIGYRALRQANLPPGGRLGIWGFGGSAHLAAQVAIAEGASVHVFTRSPDARQLAIDLGAGSAQGPYDPLEQPLDAAVLFAPAGELIPVALAMLDRGGTLAIAGIHLSDVPVLDYQRHLFQERALRSVTANTRADAEEFLRLADRMRLQVTTTPYAMDNADRALADLAAGHVNGAAVLHA